MKKIISLISLSLMLFACSTFNKLTETDAQRRVRETADTEKRQIDTFNNEKCYPELAKIKDISTIDLDSFFNSLLNEYTNNGIEIEYPVKTNPVLVSKMIKDVNGSIKSINKFLKENTKVKDEKCYSTPYWPEHKYYSCDVNLMFSSCYKEIKTKKEKIEVLLTELKEPIYQTEKKEFEKTYGEIYTDFNYCYSTAGGCGFSPVKGKIYNVSGIVRQVMPGGLRMLLSGETFDGYFSNFIMLRTVKPTEFSTGTYTPKYYARYVGPFTYTTAIGASNTVNLFEELTFSRKNGKFLFFPDTRKLSDTELNSLVKN